METVLNVMPIVLGCLVLGLFYALDRAKFNEIARGAFLAVEKEMSTAEGQEKMSQAVLRITDILPAQLKLALEFIATMTGMSLHDLTHKLAQSTYDIIFEPLRQLK